MFAPMVVADAGQAVRFSVAPLPAVIGETFTIAVLDLRSSEIWGRVDAVA